MHGYKERSPGWTRLRQGLKDHESLVENFMRVLAVDKEQGVYAGTFDGGVFRSGDGGKTWLPISRALPNDSIRGLSSISKTPEGLKVVETAPGISFELLQSKTGVSLHR